MLKFEFYSVSHSTFLTVANKEVVDSQPAVAAVVEALGRLEVSRLARLCVACYFLVDDPY